MRKDEGYVGWIREGYRDMSFQKAKWLWIRIYILVGTECKLRPAWEITEYRS